MSQRVTLAKAIRRYLLEKQDQHVSPRTLDWYSQKLHQLAKESGVEYLDELDREALLEFLRAKEAEGRSPFYVRGWHQVFRGFTAWALEQGLQVSPSLINAQSQRRWFTIKKPLPIQSPVVDYAPDEVEAILAAAGSVRNRMLIRFFVNTGLRLSEALAVRLDDLELEAESPGVRVRLGKGRKFRYVPMGRLFAKQLLRYIELERPEGPSDHLFTTLDGKPLGQQAVFGIFQRIGSKVGVEVRAHRFRHTFATNYMRQVKDPGRLQRILGHTTPDMTNRYVHMAGADLAEGIEELSTW